MPKHRRCFINGISMVTFMLKISKQIDQIQESIIEK
jgi:hypothetical protein